MIFTIEEGKEGADGALEQIHTQRRELYCLLRWDLPEEALPGNRCGHTLTAAPPPQAHSRGPPGWLRGLCLLASPSLCVMALSLMLPLSDIKPQKLFLPGRASHSFSASKHPSAWGQSLSGKSDELGLHPAIRKPQALQKMLFKVHLRPETLLVFAREWKCQKMLCFFRGYIFLMKKWVLF